MTTPSPRVSSTMAGPAPRAPGRPRTVKPDAAAFVRAVAAAHGCETLSAAQYHRLKLPEAPSARTLTRWAGATWADLCAAAGVRPGGSTPVVWTGAAKIAALRSAVSHIELQHDDRPLTLRGYRGWRAAQDDPAAWPSIDAFRGAGSWLAWCTQAKVATATRRRCRHPNKAILEVLLAAGDGSGQVGTTRYEKYRLAHPGAPSRPPSSAATGAGRPRRPPLP